jgi:hypothetical protein
MKYYYLILVIIIFIIYYYNEENESFIKSIYTRTLEKDGFMVLYNTDYIKDNVKMKKDVLKILPKDYMFIDYEYTIKNDLPVISCLISSSASYNFVNSSPMRCLTYSITISI